MAGRLTGTFQDFLQPQLLTREAVGAGDLPRLKGSVVVTRAVARAGAEPVVAGLPDGLGTQLGRTFGGVERSHGQWQRLALARGRMRDSTLLGILDEPTAALDPQAVHDLCDRYAEQAQASRDRLGTLMLLVSHRFSTVRAADLIAVLAEGKGSGVRYP